MGRVVVLGAGGFIGGHLTARLIEEGHAVTGVDIKDASQWWQIHEGLEYHPNVDVGRHDLSAFIYKADEVYNLAADMGGMGFIAGHKLECMLSVYSTVKPLIDASKLSVGRLFYSSSACVYPGFLQEAADIVALKESDAYPADPEDGYGWEKLFGERMCRHVQDETDLRVRVARYHNVYGPWGTWTGGREKAPAAICRKVAIAALTGDTNIEIWGDGEQTRSFMYVDDCVDGTLQLTRSHVSDPLNVGSSELVTINQLVTMAEDLAGVKLQRHYDFTKPQGVRGRNSDNTKIRYELDWEPTVSLASGLEKTYRWIHDQLKTGLML